MNCRNHHHNHVMSLTHHQKNSPRHHYIMNSWDHHRNHMLSLTHHQRNSPHRHYIMNSQSDNHAMSLNLDSTTTATREELFPSLQKHKEHYTLCHCWDLLTTMSLLFLMHFCHEHNSSWWFIFKLHCTTRFMRFWNSQQGMGSNFRWVVLRDRKFCHRCVVIDLSRISPQE